MEIKFFSLNLLFFLLKVEFCQTQMNFVYSIRDFIQTCLPNEEIKNLSVCDDFHVSVSKTFKIRNKIAGQLNSFVEKAFKNCPR